MLIDYAQKGKELGFRNILAVTFTNASTKEMKDRIIDVLLSLSRNQENNSYLPIIKKKTSLDDKSIKTLSKKILQEIIHNYSFFNISTIDSFFQLVLRNMTKELGIQSDFSVILDESDYNTKAVRNVIKQSKENSFKGKIISDWLFKYFLKRQDDNNSWNFERDLSGSLSSLRSDDIIKYLDDSRCSINKLKQEEKNLKERINQIKQESAQFLNQFKQICGKYSLSSDNFKGGLSSIYSKIENHFSDMKDAFLLAKAVENYYSGKEYLKEGTTPKDLELLIANMDLFLQEKTELYRSLKLFYDCIYPIGVLKALYEEKSGLLKEDDVFFISNTKNVLAKLNLQEEGFEDKVSFIYEKIGSYLERIMIDEFQDTSKADWNNLNALIRECLSYEEGRAYIFGDIKQSIYRWNDGDWRLLDNLSHMKENKVIPLDKNFRTFGNIVEFNNSLFLDLFEERYKSQSVKDGYENKGSVKITFFQKDVDMLEQTVKEIDFYLSLGYKSEDIAVLCRGTKEISLLAEYMKQIDNSENKTFKYNPVSDDAFILSSSDAVRLIIAGMEFLIDKDKVISRELIFKHNPQSVEEINSLRKRTYGAVSVFDIAVSLVNIFKIEDTVFLPAFYDCIKNFTSLRQGNLTDFLEYWESTLQYQKVETSLGNNSVRLTTIHKSKGLEYNIVILPYFSWTVFKGSEQTWIINENGEICDIPLLRSSVSALEGTCFDELYLQEKQMQRIDNLNLIYVAFTRAKKHLSVIGITAKTKQSKGAETNVGNILFNYVEQHSDLFSVNANSYLYKNIEPVYYEDVLPKENNELRIENIALQMSDNALVFSSPSEAERYFTDEDYNLNSEKALLGTAMHNIISEIRKREDLEQISSLEQYEQERSKNIRQIIKQMLAFAEKYHWFDGSFKVINEKSIGYRNGNNEFIVKRPDRIMIKGENAEIVDYKFTAFNKQQHTKYSSQVREYGNILNLMGFKNIKSYLWYIDIENPNKVNQEIILVEQS